MGQFVHTESGRAPLVEYHMPLLKHLSPHGCWKIRNPAVSAQKARAASQGWLGPVLGREGKNIFWWDGIRKAGGVNPHWVIQRS